MVQNRTVRSGGQQRATGQHGAAYWDAVARINALQADANRRAAMQPDLTLLDSVLGRGRRNQTIDGKVAPGGWLNQVAPDIARVVSPDANDFARLTDRIGGEMKNAGIPATQTLPGLAGNADANRQVIAELTAAHNEANDRVDFYRDYLSRHGDLDNADDVWTDYVNRRPYLGPSPTGQKHQVAYNKPAGDWANVLYGRPVPAARSLPPKALPSFRQDPKDANARSDLQADLHYMLFDIPQAAQLGINIEPGMDPSQVKVPLFNPMASVPYGLATDMAMKEFGAGLHTLSGPVGDIAYDNGVRGASSKLASRYVPDGVANADYIVYNYAPQPVTRKSTRDLAELGLNVASLAVPMGADENGTRVVREGSRFLEKASTSPVGPLVRGVNNLTGGAILPKGFQGKQLLIKALTADDASPAQIDKILSDLSMQGFDGPSLMEMAAGLPKGGQNTLALLRQSAQQSSKVAGTVAEAADRIVSQTPRQAEDLTWRLHPDVAPAPRMSAGGRVGGRSWGAQITANADAEAKAAALGRKLNTGSTEFARSNDALNAITGEAGDTPVQTFLNNNLMALQRSARDEMLERIGNVYGSDPEGFTKLIDQPAVRENLKTIFNEPGKAYADGLQTLGRRYRFATGLATPSVDAGRGASLADVAFDATSGTPRGAYNAANNILKAGAGPNAGEADAIMQLMARPASGGLFDPELVQVTKWKPRPNLLPYGDAGQYALGQLTQAPDQQARKWPPRPKANN